MPMTPKEMIKHLKKNGFEEIRQNDSHITRCQGQKVINHVVLAHKWFYAFMTRPNMRIKVGRMPHDIRIWGRIVKVRSTKQFVRHLLTSTSFRFILYS